MSLQADTKDWLRAVAEYLHMSLSELAVKAGLAPSTITRYINDNTNTLGITQRSLDAVANYSGVPKGVMPGRRSVPGFGEGDAQRYDAEAAAGERMPRWVEQAIAAHRGTSNAVTAWVMKSWALDMLGVLPGDILMIDQNKRPRVGDLVCAQVTDLATGKTETVMRRYEPPLIVGFSAKMGPIKAELVDDERVIIMGVETGIIRPRH